MTWADTVTSRRGDAALARDRPRTALCTPLVAAGGCGARRDPVVGGVVYAGECVTARRGAGAGVRVQALRPPGRAAGLGAGAAGADVAADRGDPAAPVRARCQRGHVHATDRP